MKVNSNLEDYNLKDSTLWTKQSFYTRVIKVNNKKKREIRINMSSSTPNQVEEKLKECIRYGCNHETIRRFKADYAVFNMYRDKVSQLEMVEISNEIESIIVQPDNSKLSETQLSQIDLALAKCEDKLDIAKRFDVSEEIIKLREINEVQSITELRRNLNNELEDSSIGLSQDYYRMAEYQEAFDIIKAHIIEFEDLRTRTDLSPEERLTRMATIPNIISLINTKDKILQSAQKEMKARSEAKQAKVEFKLSEKEEQQFKLLHEKMPILELVVARASTDNKWDPTYLLHKLNNSIYKDFRKGEYHETRVIKKEKDMELPYPSNIAVDLEEVVSNSSIRDEEESRKAPREAKKEVSQDKIDEISRKKKEILDRIKNKRDGKK